MPEGQGLTQVVPIWLNKVFFTWFCPQDKQVLRSGAHSEQFDPQLTETHSTLELVDAIR